MRGKGKSAELARWLQEHHPPQIGGAEFALLRAEIAPVSESYLRKLLRECGVPLDPMVERGPARNIRGTGNELAPIAG